MKPSTTIKAVASMSRCCHRTTRDYHWSECHLRPISLLSPSSQPLSSQPPRAFFTLLQAFCAYDPPQVFHAAALTRFPLLR